MPHASLEEALLLGSGIERPFLCPHHPDHNASACVNSLSGLWTCYACGAAGKVGTDSLTFDEKGIASFTRQLMDDMTRDRFFPESWLNVFDSLGPGDYWSSRFSGDVCRQFRLGQAPNVATYPMRDNTGCVLGIVTRDLTGEREAKYMYPYKVRISEYLANIHTVVKDDLILVEGMTDVVACAEVGFEAVGSYHAGISQAQAGLLKRYWPKTLWVAYDQDKAGEEGFRRVLKHLHGSFPIKRLVWDTYKDLADIPVEDRREMLQEVITRQVLSGSNRLS